MIVTIFIVKKVAKLNLMATFMSDHKSQTVRMET